jgi:hypothetical protein
MPLLAEVRRLAAAPVGSSAEKSIAISLQRRLNQVVWMLDEAVEAAIRARNLTEVALAR